MKARTFQRLWGLAACLHLSTAAAWGPDGHHTVGALADRLIAGTPAQAKVAALLDGLTLEQAAVWADCAKGVDPLKNYTYTSAGKYPECAIFETPAGEAEMIDYVRRNDNNCTRVGGDESCHKQYHYTDEAIQRRSYHLGDVGTEPHDVVGAIAATIHVLQGDPSPAPFAIKDAREALLLLAHFAGDIEQPLHVGAVYLDAAGTVIDPSVGTYDPATSTRGGNQISAIRVATQRKLGNFHATWDDIPEALLSSHIDATWLAAARKVPKTRGAVVDWPVAWASGTLTQARAAVKGLQFGPLVAGLWSVPLNGRYDDAMAGIKKPQLTLGGARLAQTLQAIFP